MTVDTSARISGHEVRAPWVGAAWVGAACVLTAAVVAVLTYLLAAPDTTPVAGLPDAGTITRWGLPAARALADLFAVATTGALVTAAFLVPGTPRGFTPASQHLLHAARWCAAGWAAAALASVPLTVSDIVAQPVGDVLVGRTLVEYALTTDQTLALLLTAWLALVTAAFAKSARSRATAVPLLLVCGAALLPPVLTGHAGHGEQAVLGTVTTALHVATVAVWLGCLLSLLTLARSDHEALAPSAARFSGVALGCFVLVVVTGGATAVTRLNEPGDLLTTGYGLILVGKVIVLGLVGAVAWWHRRRTLPALHAGRPRAFAVFAMAEVLLLSAALAFGAALARTEPPQDDHPTAATAGPSAWLDPTT